MEVLHLMRQLLEYHMVRKKDFDMVFINQKKVYHMMLDIEDKYRICIGATDLEEVLWCVL